MSEHTHTDAQRGISPVIGTVLLIAITVILASTVAAFALGLEDEMSGETAPTTAFDVQFDGATGGHDALTIVHRGGDAVRPDRLVVALDNAECDGSPGDPNGRYGVAADFGETDDVTAGMSYRLDGTSPTSLCSSGTLDLARATVKVIWVTEDGPSTVLRDWTGPGTS